MSVAPVAYVDASALFKLVVDEPESIAFSEAADAWPTWVSSELVEIEVLRATRRHGEAVVEIARSRLESVVLLPIDRDVRRGAGEIDDPRLRTLDAIHLATALSLGARCGVMFAYDRRLGDAARARGLPVSAPA